MCGCDSTPSAFKLGPFRAVVLPEIACQTTAVAVKPIATDRSELDGAIRLFVPGFSQSTPIVGATAYGGVFIASLRTNGSAKFLKIAPWGTDAGTVSELSAIARNEDNSLTVVDAILRRRTIFSPEGRYISHMMLRPPATTDAYGIDKRGLFVIETQASKNFSERVPGSVSRLVDDKKFVRDSFQYGTPSRHISPDGSEIAVWQRPLERNPVVAIGANGQLAINASDSLELLYLDESGAVRRFAAGGTRIKFTERQIDSSSADFGRRLMPRDPEPTAKYAREHMFTDRSHHQLIDAMLALPNDRVALRRTVACSDRQLWYVLDVKSGAIVDQFAVPLDLSPLVATGDTIFAEHRPDGRAEFAWYVARGIRPVAAQLSRAP
jgi:hypothetical protein